MSKNLRMRLYLETTVFNYFYDTERKGHDDVVTLFEKIKEGKFKGYTSRYVTDELERAQEPKKSNMLSLINNYSIVSLDYNPIAAKLAQKYIDAGIIPASHFYDSTHVAIASIHTLDAIISYNFHHINRNKTILQTGIININEGYNSIIICTAEEVLKYGGDFSGNGSD